MPDRCIRVDVPQVIHARMGTFVTVATEHVEPPPNGGTGRAIAVTGVIRAFGFTGFDRCPLPLLRRVRPRVVAAQPTVHDHAGT